MGPDPRCKAYAEWLRAPSARDKIDANNGVVTAADGDAVIGITPRQQRVRMDSRARSAAAGEGNLVPERSQSFAM